MTSLRFHCLVTTLAVIVLANSPLCAHDMWIEPTNFSPESGEIVGAITRGVIGPQAVRAAEGKGQLISPFVGRIYDWYKAHEKRDYSGPEDPGVQSVTEIYTYYKKFGISTEVMGASFRNTGQIVHLAGCDLLTISPNLLAELSNSFEPVERKLSPETAKASQAEKIFLDEKAFRFEFNEDPMAVDKTAEGIRKFSADIVKLEKLISSRL